MELAIFSRVFFSSFDAHAGLLASFATYGVGFLARPLGGLLFGSLGDRKGRKFVLLMTIAIMLSARALHGGQLTVKIWTGRRLGPPHNFQKVFVDERQL